MCELMWNTWWNTWCRTGKISPSCPTAERGTITPASLITSFICPNISLNGGLCELSVTGQLLSSRFTTMMSSVSLSAEGHPVRRLHFMQDLCRSWCILAMRIWKSVPHTTLSLTVPHTSYITSSHPQEDPWQTCHIHTVDAKTPT